MYSSTSKTWIVKKFPKLIKQNHQYLWVLVHQQLIAYLEKHNMLPKHQSGFRAHHSTETAVLKVISDILGAADQGYVALLGLLDMSAAFDTVDHDILFERLATSFGMATIISHRPITKGLLQWGSFLNRLDHYRRTAKQCPWTATVLALHSRRTTNRQPAWSWYPLLCRMMDKSTPSTRPQKPLGWSIKLSPALKRSTDECPRTVWSWILRTRNSSGWAVDNSFRKLASITFISPTMQLLPSPQSAISGFISTANLTMKVHVQ